VGGGFGMTHGKQETYPCLARPFGFVKRADLIEVLKAIVTTQRDFGNRAIRHRARLKYTIEEMGFDRFAEEVRSRAPGIEIAPPREVRWETVSDMIGWHEQGDGKLFVCICVPEGRIKDCEDGPQHRAAFRAIAETIRCPIRNTPNTNIIFHDIDPSQREEVDKILASHHVPLGTKFTAARQSCQACVALPTCGLALAESERVFPQVMDEIDKVLRRLRLRDKEIVFRMTGCPNGCARPYNVDFGFVGRSPGKYALYVGGSHAGDRLAGLAEKVVLLEDIPSVVEEYLDEYWNRARETGEAPHPSQFHVELSARAARLAAAKAGDQLPAG
jgi:sulfite reductase beta subunit-like hemoprotein